MSRLSSFLVLFLISCGVCHGQLLVDFNSTTQDIGPTNDTAGGFSAYDFAHEGSTGVDPWPTVSYPAFGGNVSVTPNWPTTFGPFAEQMIDRTPVFDENWLDLDTDLSAPTPIFGLDLVTDFLGIDTRLANDGNGDYDGTVGVPTSLHLSLSGLPANTYDWTSIHIDTEHVYGEFLVNISTDGGSTFSALPNGIMADATPMGNPDSVGVGFFDTQVQDSVAAHEVGAIYSTSFTADGTSDVVFEFIPLSQEAVHRQIWGINGFILTEGGGGGPSVTGDFNGDGNWDCQDINALTTAISASSSDLSFDMNGDGTINISDVTDGTDGWLTAGGANNTAETGGNPFLSGDANLDGVVDVADFNIWNGNKFTGASNWCDGDFTADGSVDVSDFNLWNGAKFTSSDHVSAVPEPGSLVMLMIGLVFVSCRTRKSRS